MQWDEEPESQETTRTEVKNWKFKRGIIGDSMIKQVKPILGSTRLVFRGAKVLDLLKYRITDAEEMDAIILHIGTNDVGARTDWEIFERRYVDLINAMKRAAPRAIIFLSNILPRPRDQRINTWGKYNTIIANLARQPRCAFINGCKAFAWPNGKPNRELFHNDGLHLNQKGTKLLEEVFASRTNDKMVGMYKEKYWTLLH